MNTLILNRETFALPADGWYQVAPLGEFPHSASGVVQVVDAVACVSMVNRFNEEAMGDNFAGLLIDFDHFSLDQRNKSEAAGWITGMESRDSGLWAEIRWSDSGKAAVEGGRYRFLSPVWSRKDCEELGENRLRPVRLLNAAVTNDPNLKGMVPLSNRREISTTDGTDTTDGEKVDFETRDKGRNEMKKVIEALVNRLGLASDAKEEDVLVAMEKLPSGDDFSALQNSLTEAQGEKDALAKDVESLEQELVNRDLAEFEDVISDATRGFWTEQLIQNREGARGALGELVSQRGQESGHEDAQKAQKVTKKPLHNRREARPVPRNGGGDAQADAGKETLAVKIRNRAHELCKGEGIAFSVAFRRAERELIGD